MFWIVCATIRPHVPSWNSASTRPLQENIAVYSMRYPTWRGEKTGKRPSHGAIYWRVYYRNLSNVPFTYSPSIPHRNYDRTLAHYRIGVSSTRPIRRQVTNRLAWDIRIPLRPFSPSALRET